MSQPKAGAVRRPSQPGVPAAPSPEVSGLAGAPVQSVVVQVPSRMGLYLGLAGLIIGLLIAVIVGLVFLPGSDAPPAAEAPTAAAAPIPAQKEPVPPDSAAATVPVTAEEPRPEPTAAEKPAPVVERRKKRRAPVRYGYADIASIPWAQIYVDGRNTGKTTPVKHFRLKAGRRTIKLVNPNGGLQKTLRVWVKAGGTISIGENLR